MQPLPHPRAAVAPTDAGDHQGLPLESETTPGKPLTPEDFAYFRRKLHEQLTFTRSTIREVLQRTAAEHYAQIAGQVHDVQDESLADLLVDVNLGEIDREVQALRDIEAARSRIGAGTFGRCLDCGEPMGWRRLDAYPTATRCLECQVRHEQRGTPTPTPRL